MDRTRTFKKLQSDRTAGEARVKKLLEEKAAAKAVFEESRRPELSFIEATNRVRAENDALTRLTESGEAELRQHAEPFITAARTRLSETLQETRRKLDHGGGSGNRAAVQARMAALRNAVDRLDELAISGEDDLPAAVKRVMSIFADFETVSEYDLEFSPPAPQRHERFMVEL